MWHRFKIKQGVEERGGEKTELQGKSGSYRGITEFLGQDHRKRREGSSEQLGARSFRSYPG